MGYRYVKLNNTHIPFIHNLVKLFLLGKLTRLPNNCSVTLSLITLHAVVVQSVSTQQAKCSHRIQIVRDSLQTTGISNHHCYSK